MSQKDVRTRDDTNTCRAKVPAAYTVVKHIGEPETLTGSAWLCFRSDITTHDPAIIRDNLRVVKVPNGSIVQQYDKEEDTKGAGNTAKLCNSVVQLKKECKLASTLTAHPRIVRIHEYADHTNKNAEPYIAMAAVRGPSIWDYQQSGRQASPAFLWHVCNQIVEALLYLHHGVSVEHPKAARQLLPSWHGDIRSANVILDNIKRDNPRFPNVVLIDFGNAHIHPLNKPVLEKSTGNSSLLDLKGLCQLIHGLAHNHDAEELYEGKCECKGLGEDGPFTRSDELFSGMWTKLIEEQRGTSEAQRLETLVKFLLGVRERRDAHLAEDQAFTDLATDAEILAALGPVVGTAAPTALQVKQHPPPRPQVNPPTAPPNIWHQGPRPIPQLNPFLSPLPPPVSMAPLAGPRNLWHHAPHPPLQPIPWRAPPAIPVAPAPPIAPAPPVAPTPPVTPVTPAPPITPVPHIPATPVAPTVHPPAQALAPAIAAAAQAAQAGQLHPNALLSTQQLQPATTALTTIAGFAVDPRALARFLRDQKPKAPKRKQLTNEMKALGGGKPKARRVTRAGTRLGTGS